ncbi:MAG: hypothetical protein PHT19_06230 [Methylococcus sp.]|nr:hypothetical protein [Methylococcus sp.]
MSLRLKLKEMVESAPEGLMRPLVYLPYSLRLGRAYVQSVRAIAQAERTDPVILDARRLSDLRRLLQFAVDEVPFYSEFYSDNGFSPSDLRSWDDWARVPLVTKGDLQLCSQEARNARGAKGVKINTGGTSGQPLEFLLDGQAFAREWAHMHHLWKARGYRPQHLKLTFRGKHFDARQTLRYNAVHNELVVNANAPMAEVVRVVAALPRAVVIRWLHGYPSLIAEFAHAYAAKSAAALAVFRTQLFGALLGSEYPAPVYRTVIDEVLTSNIVSWYGHSEMAVLARETSKGMYESLPTYGYAEAVPTSHGGEYRLVCTSLHNRAHPFIRYDTGDLIEPVSQQGGSLAFRITDGRVGDFVLDRHGKRHSLTAIVFGRHHAAFDLVKHLQLREDAPGFVTLMVTPRDAAVDRTTLRQGFDLDDLDIEWKLEVVEAPVRTQAGKIRLKIS